MSYYIERESAYDFLPYEIPKETDIDSYFKKVVRYFQKQAPEISIRGSDIGVN